MNAQKIEDEIKEYFINLFNNNLNNTRGNQTSKTMTAEDFKDRLNKDIKNFNELIINDFNRKILKL
jgi:hypothetical protein